MASGEKKGKANAGMGSLKSLVELKLNGCLFREKTLARPDGEAIYKQCVPFYNSKCFTLTHASSPVRFFDDSQVYESSMA